MNKLICEICGGKLVANIGGVFICDNCGMEYSKDRLKEMITDNKTIPQNESNTEIKKN